MQRALIAIFIAALILGAAAAVPPGAGAQEPLLQMVLIQAGSFKMGSPNSERGRVKDEVQHEASIGRPFYLSRYEVTQEQWTKVMAGSPSEFVDCGADCPVEQVTWPMAVEFCNKLSDMEGLKRCYSGSGDAITWDRECTGYRLPSEAEWEYAARAGESTAYAGTDKADELRKYAVFQQVGQGPRPVGSMQPNAWDLYDLNGNVWEWVWDWYAPYPEGKAGDPAGPEEGKYRIVRGGGYFSNPEYCRNAMRGAYIPSDVHGFIGLRPARSAAK